ncbi:S-adenosyl-L-methionine-dependent methyltransferase [Aspergillus taichungensis]|uniref:S-adenosyl-L-methionine-dependent methyltransferase n=1 Tax=Aspergillus taichungensis TaxID=482145 RepID=A0A2J5HWQ7_9EURO|nr:S-adenosyl-L-methionine-dependent methyltransferase [Aspergillus taichungensis]
MHVCFLSPSLGFFEGAKKKAQKAENKENHVQRTKLLGNYSYDLTLPTLSKLPDYFRDHQYVMPREYESCPMQWAVGQSQFEWLAQRKLSQTRFSSYMASRRQGRPAWFDTFPVERLSRTAVARDDAVFLVDVGGNQGHDLVRFRKRFPSLPGRVVLQDLPKVVASAAVSSLREDGVEIMGYSFFDPQPVKGARIYYFRAIFHDWPDDVCRQILANTVSAMDTEYSRIVIVDFVLPDTHAPLLQSSLDIQMMSIGAGAERSESQWKELLGSAGLEIQSVWRIGPGMESVMEIAVR